MSEYEHKTRLTFADRSRLFGEFMKLLPEDIPAPYLKHLKTKYNIDPHRLREFGARYLGSGWEAAKETMIDRHGSAVLVKAGLMFKAHSNRTYFRFEPVLWKKVPLVLIPAKSEGFIESLIGYAPLSDHDLSVRDTTRWHNTFSKSTRGVTSLIGLTEPVAEGTVVLCSDIMDMISMSSQGYTAICVPMFTRFLGSWVKKLGEGHVYVSRDDANAFAEELAVIDELFVIQQKELRVADIYRGGDFMQDLRGSVGLPKQEPVKRSRPVVKRTAPRPTHQPELQPTMVQSSLL